MGHASERYETLPARLLTSVCLVTASLTSQLASAILVALMLNDTLTSFFLRDASGKGFGSEDAHVLARWATQTAAVSLAIFNPQPAAVALVAQRAGAIIAEHGGAVFGLGDVSRGHADVTGWIIAVNVALNSVFHALDPVVPHLANLAFYCCAAASGLLLLNALYVTSLVLIMDHEDLDEQMSRLGEVKSRKASRKGFVNFIM